MNKEEYIKSLSGTEVAIIGYALRFPGASSGEAFWQSLVQGEESVHFLTDEELTALNVSPETYKQKRFVRAVVKDIAHKEYFDHTFFGYTPEEARVMDPQMRVFHELVWEALEHSGQASQTDRHKIGLFAGAASSFSHEMLSMAAGLNQKIGAQIASRLVNKDYLCSRTAYALNLKGPCFTIQTACSTSLVAVHVATRSLLTGECKMALAGGISIQPEKNKGYLYDEGGVLSGDGHCRAFDADSSGTIFGEGGCVVMLKRLKDALQDNDTIHAVIKGSAINNDGNRKVGFTAPSIEGQIDVIKLAHKIARVEPESIQYIEAHGTGTKLGDPIELQALQAAFSSLQKNSCAIGAVKTNVGHLDTAAGIAGLMKVVLALKYKQIPPSLNYKTPNPNFDFGNSPFYVNQALSPWKSDSVLRKAGVSSFGIGGTNAHVVVEEAPVFEPSGSAAAASYQVIPVSAKTPAALKKVKTSLAEFLQKDPATLPDVSFTLQRGRKHFAFRNFIIAKDGQEIAEAWSNEDGATVAPAAESNIPVVFMFGGQGSQYHGITRELYCNFEPYRKEADLALACLPPALKEEILNIILCDAHNKKDLPQIPTRLTQPLLFIMEYALARVLMASGITPDAMIGHSIGEYVAACVSGVISLEDALDLVAFRGEIMEQSREGAMLSISAPDGKWEHLLNKEVSVAAVNSRNSRVLSGPPEQIQAIEQKLLNENVTCRRLHTNKAFHSALMEEALPAFRRKLESKKWNTPRIPYISNLTGRFIQPDEVMDPLYWVKHLRHTVEFAKGLDELGKMKKRIFVEIGSAKNLSTFVKDQLGAQQVVVDLVRHPKAEVSDEYFFLKGVCELWRAGKEVLWDKINPSETSRKVPLPAYPFERSRFWNDFNLSDLLHKRFKSSRSRRHDDLAYIPVWKRSALTDTTASAGKHILVLGDHFPERREMITIWSNSGHNVVAADQSFSSSDQQLFDALKQKGFAPEIILVFAGGIPSSENNLAGHRAEAMLVSLLQLFQAISQAWGSAKIEIRVITRNSQDVIGEDLTAPWSAALTGFVKVCALEYKNLKCALVDIESAPLSGNTVKLLARELTTPAQDIIAAWRRGYRWTLHIEQTVLPELADLALPQRPVILITGGAGATGIALSRHFIEKYKATIILVGLSELPARTAWEDWKTMVPEDDAVLQKINALLALETGDNQVLYYSADISDLGAMQNIMADVNAKAGKIHGVVHAAGSAERSALALMDEEMVHQQVRAKAGGVFVLEKLLADQKLCFFVNFSSLNTARPFFGQGGYAAANAVLEAFCYSHSLQCDAVKTISWDTFGETGMAVQGENDQLDSLHAFRFDVHHPLVAYRAQNRNGHDVIVSYLSSDLWVLNEHRVVRQKPTLPAKAYIEVLYAALRTLHPGKTIEISNLLISSPLVAEAGSIRAMKTLLEKRNDKYTIKIVSRAGSSYQEHARAEAQVLPMSDRAAYEIKGLAAGGVEKHIGTEPSGSRETTELGPRWHNLKWVRIGDKEGLSHLELEKTFQADTLAFLLHPAMVDMASGFLYMAKKGQHTYLPYYYEQITIYDRIPSACYSHVTLKNHSDDNLTFDVRLLDESGRELMFISNYTYKAYIKPAMSARPAVPLQTADTRETTIIEKTSTHALTTAQVITSLERALASTHKHLIISRQNCEDIDFRFAEDKAVEETPDEVEHKDDIVLRERSGMSAAFAEAVTPTQKFLAEDWQRFFGIKQVGILDDFFELGGDSLKSTTIISRINKAFKVTVSLTEFFKNSNIRKLAEYIDQSSQSGTLCLPRKAEKKSFYPLSSSQKRIFFLQQVYKDQTAYNITEAFKLNGTLNRERLEQAIGKLLQRHDSLRIKLVMVNNTPYQQILESVPVKVEYHQVDERDISTALYAFRRPFDFDKPPYIRFGVFQTGKDNHCLIVDILHMIADGTSLLILIKEFWSLYHQQTLPPVPLNQIDFTEWQERLRRSGYFEKQRAFWKQYLSGDLARLKLPFDSLSPRDMENTGGNQSIILSKETTLALRSIIRQYEATEFILMVALFHTFLSKLTGQNDIITGVPTAGRTHEEFNESVGMFVNTTVIRSKIDPQGRFSDLLREVKKNTLLVFDNQDFQYEMIMDMVRQESGKPVTSLFNVILNYRNMFVSGEKTTGKEESIQGASAALEDTSAKHDLVLFIYDNPDHFSITCNYPTALFNPETITFMMKEFIQLSDQVAHDHERMISGYDIFRKESVLTADHQAAVFDL